MSFHKYPFHWHNTYMRPILTLMSIIKFIPWRWNPIEILGLISHRAMSQLSHTEIWNKIDQRLLRYARTGKKVYDVIHENWFFSIHMAIWWRYDVFNDQMIHEIASTVPTLSKYEKKIGGHQPFWGAMADWRWSCFCTQKRIDARADFELWRTRTTLLLHRNGSKFQNVLFAVSETWIQWKNGFPTLRLLNARKNARARAYARKFEKC